MAGEYGCMIGLGAMLNIDYREMVQRWTQEDVRPPRPVRKG